nr:hypothetical protein [Saprospiraceae bacterium]
MCSSTMKDRARLLTRPACSKNSNAGKHSLWLFILSLIFLFPTSDAFSQRESGRFNFFNRVNILALEDECADGTTPSYATATPDGDDSEWDLTNDFFANMYEAGNPTKELLSKAYLRYDCNTNTLCVLVIMENENLADQSAADSWMKVYDINNSTQVDGTSTEFAWLPNRGGWEGCFSLAEDSYAEVEIHVNTDGRTSSTGKKAQGYVPLCIDCPTCPPAGQSCDDEDPTTENDMTDGECGCAGTPCPDAGQSCDDEDPTTENDMTDGECGCAGT